VVATNSASDINALILLFQLVHQGPKRLIQRPVSRTKQR